MYSFRDPGTPFTRSPVAAPVTCAACGCRLERSEDGAWRHFHPFGGRDARGCRVECVDRPHDRTGAPVTD